MNEDVLRILMSDIDVELGHLDTLVGEMEAARRLEASLARRSMGSILHDFYGCCERIFRTIAVEMNGGYDESEQWHKSLLYRMTIRLKGIRPEVISEELAAELDEYLAFRHAFRNIYGFELKGERVIRLSDRMAEIVARFTLEMRNFKAFLEKEITDPSSR